MMAFVLQHIIPAAYALLPAPMHKPDATLLLLAIGQHESEFRARRQRPSGPARGFWQFEEGGLRQILQHGSTYVPTRVLCQQLLYHPNVADLKAAIRHNDVLACACARLLLWTHPEGLPRRGDSEAAYRYYLDTWHPGRPRPQDWGRDYAKALAITAPMSS